MVLRVVSEVSVSSSLKSSNISVIKSGNNESAPVFEVHNTSGTLTVEINSGFVV
jgi:hypothetical protein